MYECITLYTDPFENLDKMDKDVKENMNYQKLIQESQYKTLKKIGKDPSINLPLPPYHPGHKPFIVIWVSSTESQRRAPSHLTFQSVEEHGAPPVLFYKASLFLISRQETTITG